MEHELINDLPMRSNQKFGTMEKSYSQYVLKLSIINKTSSEVLSSIIIVNYGYRYLRELVESLSKQTSRNFEVILIDNSPNSVDNIHYISKLIKNYLSDVQTKLVSMSTNVGFCIANNIGLELAQGKYIVLLNNDTTVEPNWLEELVNESSRNDSIGAVASVTVYHGTKVVEQCGTELDVYGASVSHLGGIHKEELEHMPLEKTDNFFYGTGASLLIKKNIIEHLGFLFDDRLFMYTEDVDLCWAIRLLGYKIGVSRNSVCYHRKNPLALEIGIDLPSWKFYYAHARNRILILIKNYELKNLLLYLPSTIMLVGIRAILTSLIKRDPSYIECYLRGLLWNIRNLPGTLRMRSFIQSRRKISDEQIKRHMLNKSFEILYFMVHRNKK